MRADHVPVVRVGQREEQRATSLSSARRRARSRCSGGARSAPRRAGCRASPGRACRAGSPCGRSPATAPSPAGCWAPSRSSWCGRSSWCRSGRWRPLPRAWREVRVAARASSPGTSCARTGARSRSGPRLVVGAHVVPDVDRHDRRAWSSERITFSPFRACTSRTGSPAARRRRRGGWLCEHRALLVGRSGYSETGVHATVRQRTALRPRGCRISPAMTTCETDAQNRADAAATIDVPGPLRARRLRLLADARAGLGAGPARAGDRRRRPPHPRAAWSSASGESTRDSLRRP